MLVLAEENKAPGAAFLEALLEKLDILEEVYASDLVLHEPDQAIQGLEEARQFVSMYKRALPDLHATVEEVLVEETR